MTSISALTPGSAAPALTTRSDASAGGHAARDLAKSLRLANLPAAVTAYDQLVRNAPQGVSRGPGSAVATLGEALGRGNVGEARQIMPAAIQELRTARPPFVAGPPEDKTTLPVRFGGSLSVKA